MNSDLFATYSDLLKGKGNPYHDERGRFTSGPGGGGGRVPKTDPRVRLADALSLNLLPLFRIAAGDDWSPTARENARVKIDRTLAVATSKLNWNQMLTLQQRDRRALADKILPQMTSRERGKLADLFRVRNELAIVGTFLRMPTSSLKRLSNGML